MTGKQNQICRLCGDPLLDGQPITTFHEKPTIAYDPVLAHRCCILFHQGNIEATLMWDFKTKQRKG